MINIFKAVQPDPTLHRNISFVKSVFRIAAGICLAWPQNMILAGLLLIVAEIIGVVEELV